MQFKKPKFWNLSKPNFISLFLLPLTIPVIINNFLLSKKPKQNLAKVKTICRRNQKQKHKEQESESAQKNYKSNTKAKSKRLSP